MDHSLIHNLDTSKEKQAKVQSITEYAQKNEIKILASYVESANCLAALCQYNIDLIQGYFLQQPNELISTDFEIDMH